MTEATRTASATEARSIRQTPSAITSGGDIAVNVAGLQRLLKAENLSPWTMKTYLEAAEQFARFLAEKDMPQDVASIRREHVVTKSPGAWPSELPAAEPPRLRWRADLHSNPPCGKVNDELDHVAQSK